MTCSESFRLLLGIIDPNYQWGTNVSNLDPIKKHDLLKKTLKLAEKNGLRYYFIQRLKEYAIEITFIEKDELTDENERSKDFIKTVDFINTISKKYDIEYILIKFFNTVPHIPNDIDLFIRKDERQKFMKILEQNGMVCIHSSPAETKFKGQYRKIDIYTEICYVGVEFIDEKFLRQSVTQNDLFEVKYSGLNKEADFLLLIPHALFGHRRLTLLDFLHLMNLKKDIRIKECRQYAYDMRWGKVFDLMIIQLDNMNEDIYKNKKTLCFPYTFEREFLLKCMYQLDNFEKQKFSLFFFNVSFYLEELEYRLEDTKLYSLIKSFGPARNLVNSICAFVKNKRGDSKSIE